MFLNFDSLNVYNKKFSEKFR